MSRHTATAEDAALPTITVGGRVFPIGPVTIWQLFSVKNLVVSIITQARISKAKRETQTILAGSKDDLEARTGLREKIAGKLGLSLGTLAQYDTEMRSEKGHKRDALAEKMGVDVATIFEIEAVDQLTGYAERQLAIVRDEGFGDDGMGQLLHILSTLTERQLADIARFILDRNQDTRVTVEFIEREFNLEWFTEALALFLEHNHVQSIAKNLQRLAGLLSMQMATPAAPTTISTSSAS